MNFVPSKPPANSGFSKFQIEYFYVFSPAFLSKRFCELKTGGNIRRCTQAVEGSALEIGIASWNAPPEKVLIYAGFRGFENEKIFEFSPSVLPIFQSGLGEDTTWRVVRVVEGATLEKSCAARHLGFESLTLRQPEKPVLPASLFYSRFPIPKPASIASAEITFELYSRCA